LPAPSFSTVPPDANFATADRYLDAAARAKRLATEPELHHLAFAEGLAVEPRKGFRWHLVGRHQSCHQCLQARFLRGVFERAVLPGIGSKIVQPCIVRE
jgi:hypothetical protein